MSIIEIELDKPREIRFDFNAIADVELETGMGIGSLFSETNIGFNTFRVLLWAGLKHEDRSITKAKAGELIGNYLKNGGSWTELGDKIFEAIEASGIMGN